MARSSHYGRWGEGGERHFPSRLRVLSPTTGGYLGTMLTDNAGKKRFVKVHLAVLQAFVGPRPLGFDACHNDGCVINNTLSNLRWDSKSQNNRDKEHHGTAQRGSRNGAAKLDEIAVRSIKARLSSTTMSALAREFGVSVTAVWQIKKGIKWQHVI